ncbi:hypothetical protein [Janthinobacterium sp. B9-8]|uniref:hypothetical protein n=1 Tax=Janthinobacterium sp. B9-8 TaxID=1236179 RepID=UPI00061D0D6A|nr:hypothetical protein [Janthinobacterium sp. B9-8]AMC36482.1 hypothetical protein VN23_18765 [Janthinobacterium sp. B9-8]
MHLMIFLVVLVALVTGLSFIGETYADYQTHFIVFTALYFMVWWLASKVFGVKAVDSSPSNLTALSLIERFARLPFRAVASFYFTGLSMLFAVTLLVAGHSFSALIVAAFGLGIAIVIAGISE